MAQEGQAAAARGLAAYERATRAALAAHPLLPPVLRLGPAQLRALFAPRQLADLVQPLEAPVLPCVGAAPR